MVIPTPASLRAIAADVRAARDGKNKCTGPIGGAGCVCGKMSAGDLLTAFRLGAARTALGGGTEVVLEVSDPDTARTFRDHLAIYGYKTEYQAGNLTVSWAK